MFDMFVCMCEILGEVRFGLARAIYGVVGVHRSAGGSGGEPQVYINPLFHNVVRNPGRVGVAGGKQATCP